MPEKKYKIKTLYLQADHNLTIADHSHKLSTCTEILSHRSSTIMKTTPLRKNQIKHQ